MTTKLHFVKGDITEMAVDAIVSPVNTHFEAGGGVATAILRKGGNRVQEECDSIGSIALGETVVTTAGTLKAFYVIHAAVITPGGTATAKSVRLAAHNTLSRAEEKAFKSLAFPALGTGAAGFAMEECASILIQEVLEHLKSRTSLEKIYFVLFDDAALAVFEETFGKLAGHPAPQVT
ncbi:MAG TPA: macro domain-containing protein [Terriglobia bacterium]|nr:macro domain-containing protein [Terriglobia bacterium]